METKNNKKYDLSKGFDPKLIKSLNYDELYILCDDIRKNILTNVSINGGHLSSNLGIVELTVAIHHYYNLPKDKLIFDVSHQCYSHKILSGRKLENLRKEDGVSGFQSIKESEYDSYSGGHSSTSISAAMGFALTRDLDKKDYRVIAVIGDSAFANGLSFEAFNNLSDFKHKVIIILNDNNRSITKAFGVTHNFLEMLKKSSSIDTKKFDGLGFTFIPNIDGHNIEELERAFIEAEKSEKSVILHVITKKGKGYQKAENDIEGIWHGVTPFDIETGLFSDTGKEGYFLWSDFYTNELEKCLERDEKIGELEKLTIIELADELMNMSLYESDAPDAGDYLRYQYGGYTLTYSEEKGFLKYKYLLKITPEYYTNADEEAVVDELVEEAILNSGLDENSTDYEKILWTHNFICDTVSYDTVHKHTPGSGHIQSTAYSALYYHTALCQGYAVLCYRLLKELGVDNRIVTGTATVSGEQQRHAWNIVKLDGSYYNLDVTMDDVDSAYDYFLKTDEIFDKNHTVEKSLRFSYFRAVGAFPFLDFREARFEAPLHALLRRAIIFFAEKRIGQALHIRNFFFCVVRVLVSLAVAEIFHQLGRRVPYHKRHRLVNFPERVLSRRKISDLHRVRFRRHGEIDDRLGQMHRTFRHSDKVTSLIRRHRNLQRTRIGKTYIFTGKARHAPRNVKRILARFQHTRQPINGRVGIGIPHRFVQRGNQIVMLLSLFIVKERFP